MSEELVEDILAATTPDDLAKIEENDISISLNNNEDEKSIINEKEDLNDQKEVKNEVEDKSEASSDPEPTIEDLARKIGWRPEYDKEDAVDAVTYILKSREIQETMKETNNNLKSQLSNMQNSINALKEHNERIYKSDVRKMQAEIDLLKKQKQKAVELADVDEVNAIDKQIDNIQKDLNEPKKPEASTTDPIYDEWIKDNQWYLTNQEMAIYAENVAEQYQGAPLERLYKIVTQKVAEVFPEKFASVKPVVLSPKEVQEVNPKKAKPIGPTNPVEAPTNKGVVPSFTKANLTPEQTNIMRQFVRQGIMTEEQYINDIAKMQE